MLRVTFIHHSAFVVETEHRTLVFDYFPSEDFPEQEFHGKKPVFAADKPIYVFASHGHRDHFSREVLRWGEKRKDMTYIFSRDIRVSRLSLLKDGMDPTLRKRIRFMLPVSDLELDGMKIHTLRSTEVGVAFYVECDGYHFYHAGDLNEWNVSEGGGSLFTEIYTGGYEKEIRYLRDKHIDLAFVVLDPRLGTGAYKGMDVFLNAVQADLVFPMHLWERFDLVRTYKKRPQVSAFWDKIVDVDRDNVIFEIE